jgi:hypothetical protein
MYDSYFLMIARPSTVRESHRHFASYMLRMHHGSFWCKMSLWGHLWLTDWGLCFILLHDLTNWLRIVLYTSSWPRGHQQTVSVPATLLWVFQPLCYECSSHFAMSVPATLPWVFKPVCNVHYLARKVTKTPFLLTCWLLCFLLFFMTVLPFTGGECRSQFVACMLRLYCAR